MSKTIRLKHVIMFLIGLSCLFANARVAFSRPGSILRLPSASETSNYNQYIVGFSGEATHSSDLNYSSAAYLQGILVNGYHVGLSYNTNPKFLKLGESTSSDSYISFHVHKTVFRGNNVTIDFGIHDMLYTAKSPHRVSLFSLASYAHQFNHNYKLDCSFGLGTGYIASDSHKYTESNYPSDSGQEFFIGFKLHTPLMKSMGGVQFLMEFDGGFNLGTSIPLGPSFTFNAGITHFENLGKFNEWGEGNLLPSDAPALAVGVQINIPRRAYKKPITKIPELANIYNQIPYDASVDSLMNQANFFIHSLEDSLALQQQAYSSALNTNEGLHRYIHFLEDSLSVVILDDKLRQNSLNNAMKFLSKSLEAYYNEEFELALKETEKAINIFPDLSIAYARKGSIYYRMGDYKRATINWNIALKLDPEYDEVRAVLLDVKENEDVQFNKLPE